jgi:hypothetical protein
MMRDIEIDRSGGYKTKETKPLSLQDNSSQNRGRKENKYMIGLAKRGQTVYWRLDIIATLTINQPFIFRSFTHIID